MRQWPDLIVNQKMVFGDLGQVMAHTDMGKPLHSLIIAGNIEDYEREALTPLKPWLGTLINQSDLHISVKCDMFVVRDREVYAILFTIL